MDNSDLPSPPRTPEFKRSKGPFPVSPPYFLQEDSLPTEFCVTPGKKDAVPDSGVEYDDVLPGATVTGLEKSISSFKNFKEYIAVTKKFPNDSPKTPVKGDQSRSQFTFHISEWKNAIYARYNKM